MGILDDPESGECLPGCPFSAETFAACRHYRPVSEHSDVPGAELCRYALIEPVSDRVRRFACARLWRAPSPSGVTTAVARN